MLTHTSWVCAPSMAYACSYRQRQPVLATDGGGDTSSSEPGRCDAWQHYTTPRYTYTTPHHATQPSAQASGLILAAPVLVLLVMFNYPAVRLDPAVYLVDQNLLTS